MYRKWATYGCCVVLLTGVPLAGQHLPYILDTDQAIFGVIEQQLLADDPDTVVELCEAVLDRSARPRVQGTAHFYLAQARQWQPAEVAATGYATAMRLFLQADYGPGLGMAYAKMGELQYLDLAYAVADSFFTLAIPLCKAHDLYRPLANIYQFRADMANEQQRTDHALSLLKQALTYARRDTSHQLTRDLINQIATNHHASGELDSAEVYFDQSLVVKQRLGDVAGQLGDRLTLGTLQRERGDYAAAQEQLLVARALAETERDTFTLVAVYTELAEVHTRQELWSTAEAYHRQALDLAQRMGRPFALATVHRNLGTFYQLRGDEAAAIPDLEAALEFYQQLNNTTQTAEVLVQLSHLYANEQNYAEAKTLLLDALAIRETSQDPMSAVKIRQTLATIELDQGNLRQGIAYAEAARSTYATMRDPQGLQDTYALLAEAYARTGDYRRAYRYSQQFAVLRDSLTSVERTQAVKELDALYNTTQKDKEIATINEQATAQRVELLERTNQVYLLAGGVAILLLVMGLLLFVFWKNRQLNRQRIALLEREKEAARLKAVIEGEEQERKRFARELHDGLGAMLATVKMHISGLRRKLPAAATLPTFQQAETLIDEACRNVREISHNLMPHVLEEQGLFSALEELCHNLSAQTATQYTFMHFGADQGLPDTVQITLLRCTQELLKNSSQHAAATEVIVQLTVEPREAILIVEDDGRGFDTTRIRQGIGLSNIQSRVDYLKGTFEIDSRIGTGSTFTIQLSYLNAP